MALNLPGLQAIASRLMGEHAAPIQAQARAQDKFNLDVNNALSPLVNPIAWTPLTLINNWAIYDNASNTPAYYQDPNGRIWFKGFVKGGSLSTNIFAQSMPPPPRDWYLVTTTDTGIGRFKVNTLGAVQLVAGGTGFASLDSLTYVP